MMWQYVVESSLWSFGGLFVGWVLGKIERDVGFIRKKVEHDD